MVRNGSSPGNDGRKRPEHPDRPGQTRTAYRKEARIGYCGSVGGPKPPAPAGKRGRPPRRPDVVLAGRGFDRDKRRGPVRRLGVKPPIARREPARGAHLRSSAPVPPPADPLGRSPQPGLFSDPAAPTGPFTASSSSTAEMTPPRSARPFGPARTARVGRRPRCGPRPAGLEPTRATRCRPSP